MGQGVTTGTGVIEGAWSLELLQSLSGFARKAAVAASLDELGEALMDAVCSLVTVKHSGLYLYDPATGQLRLVATRGFTTEEREEAARTAARRHPMEVIRTGEILHVPDVEQDELQRTSSSNRSFRVRSRLFVPVKVADRVIGTIGLGGEKPHEFNENHVHALTFAANMAGAVYARMQAHEETRRREQRLQLVLQGGRLGSWDWTVATGAVVFDQGWAQMLGYRLEDVRPHVDTWAGLVHPDDMPEVEEGLKEHLEGRSEVYRSEHRLLTASGQWKWILDVGQVVERDDEGKPVRAVGFHQDITDRKNAEEALRVQNMERKVLLDTMDAQVWYLKDPNTYGRVNRAHSVFLGKSPEEIENRPIASLFEPSVVERCVSSSRVPFLEKRQVYSEEWVPNASGEPRLLAVSKVPDIDEDGNVRHVVCVATDITEKYRAEMELVAYKTQLERRVAERTRDLEESVNRLQEEVTHRKRAQRRLIDSQKRLRDTTESLSLVEEQERRKIAVQVHDGLGQELTLARIRLRTLSQSAKGKNLKELVLELDEQLKALQRQARDLTADLSANVLYQFGLESAVEDLMQATEERTGIPTEFLPAEQSVPLRGNVEVLLYGAIKELVHNAVKHSAASKISVQFLVVGENYVARVLDDGVGINEDLEKGKAKERARGREKGFGLFSVRERILNLGGQMQLKVGKKGGTSIDLVFPVEKIVKE